VDAEALGQARAQLAEIEIAYEWALRRGCSERSSEDIANAFDEADRLQRSCSVNACARSSSPIVVASRRRARSTTAQLRAPPPRRDRRRAAPPTLTIGGSASIRLTRRSLPLPGLLLAHDVADHARTAEDASVRLPDFTRPRRPFFARPTLASESTTAIAVCVAAKLPAAAP